MCVYIYICLVGGFNPSEKYEFVSWDDEIPNIWNNKIHVPNHQPDKHIRPLISIWLCRNPPLSSIQVADALPIGVVPQDAENLLSTFQEKSQFLPGNLFNGPPQGAICPGRHTTMEDAQTQLIQIVQEVGNLGWWLRLVVFFMASW